MLKGQLLCYMATTVPLKIALATDKFLERRYENNQYEKGDYILMANQIQPALLAEFTAGYGETNKDVTVRFSQQVQLLILV